MNTEFRFRIAKLKAKDFEAKRSKGKKELRTEG
jgi:hypothetical protein